ncbi:hypothetical protein ACOMHN_010361 [Nucella lapillus]
MEEENKKGRLALERNLQKAFKAVQSVGGVVQSTAVETLPHIQTVANLLGQYECCAAVDYGITPLDSDFRGLLSAKIRNEIVEKVNQLKSMIEVLRMKQEVIGKLCETSLSLVRKYSSSLDVASLTADSPTTPSLADVMEWLESVDTMLYQQYWSKVELLEMVQGEEAMSDSLVPRWTDQDELLADTVKDGWTQVEMFFSEKR